MSAGFGRFFGHSGEAESCLGCCVARGIRGYFERHGDRTPDGHPIFDAVEITTVLAEQLAEVIASGPSRPERRRARTFANDAIDAAVRAALTGRPQPVDMPALETEH